jgi:4'-phosphopantetheinyl transferase
VIFNYVQVRDAKMALASALLKRYAIAKLSPRAWSDTHALTKTRGHKPIFIDPTTGTQPVAFNVTHQAGIVAIAAVADYAPAEVGIDIVCPAERRARDHDMVRTEGWPAFVDMHGEVFSRNEVAYLKYQVLSAMPRADSSGGAQSAPPPTTSEQVLDWKLREFYALWALREAYLKMSGDALVATWVRDLEFRRWRAPRPTPAWEVPAREEEGAEEVIRGTEMRLHGRRVEDVNVCLRSVGPDYMIATALRTPGKVEDGLGWTLGPYTDLSLDEVLDFAEASA